MELDKNFVLLSLVYLGLGVGAFLINPMNVIEYNLLTKVLFVGGSLSMVVAGVLVLLFSNKGLDTTRRNELSFVADIMVILSLLLASEGFVIMLSLSNFGYGVVGTSIGFLLVLVFYATVLFYHLAKWGFLSSKDTA